MISLQAVLDLLDSAEYQNTLSFLMESPQYQNLIDSLMENGIDVKQIYEYLANEFEMVDQ